MRYVVRDRNGKESYTLESKIVKFLYGTFIGRCFVKVLSFPIFSKIVGWFLNRGVSKFKIKSFVEKNKIDMSLYEKNSFKSFNDFFTRKLKKEYFNVDMNKDSFISPSDAKLSSYVIDDNSEFLIKDSYYSVCDLLGGNPIYKNYIGGYLLVFRLCADDYHRYIYIDDGSKEKNVFIKGRLNTVRPIAYEHFDIFKKNSREYSVLYTENFGDVIQVEVGAVLVGKINNFHEEHNFKRGEEKGCFEFGGSTIVLLVEKDKVIIDKDILKNSSEGVETKVSIGKKIGRKKS